ncbi:MAG: hypothetical protein DRP93_07105, partial [Candidatus Neomarinimicrobiota bacterium]
VVESPESWYLGDLALYMYNGYNRMPYCLDTIDEFEIGERIGPFQFYTWYQRGIQNDMEGMILVFKDSLCDIIAYEGSFIGANDPALGKEFPDIGIYETGHGSDTSAIYLSGMPGSVWLYGPATPGELNADQEISELELPVVLSNFYAKLLEDRILLRWQSESESENSRYHLYRNGSHIASIEGKGTISIPNSYTFMDEDVFAGINYEYILSNIDYSGKESFLDTLINIIIKTGNQLKPFCLGLPYPNPFNPTCDIKLQVYKASEIKMELYDLSGRKIMNILEDHVSEGEHAITINLDKYPSGKYFVHCSGAKQHEILEIVKLK